MAPPEAPTVEPAVEPTVSPDVKTRTKTRFHPRWKVLLLDDDVTTIDFVVYVLVSLFHKEATEAVRLTFEVHETGSALITVTSMERAELYVEQVRSLARPQGYPLTATIEPAE